MLYRIAIVIAIFGIGLAGWSAICRHLAQSPEGKAVFTKILEYGSFLCILLICMCLCLAQIV